MSIAIAKIACEGDNLLALCEECEQRARDDGHTGNLPNVVFEFAVTRWLSGEPCEGELCDGCCAPLETP